MPKSAKTKFWNRSLQELGVQGMEKSLAPNAGWEAVVQSGREEFAACQRVISMTTGPDRRVIDIGCGLGRVSFALAEHFGEVVGVDLAIALIEEAQSRSTSPQVSFKPMTSLQLEPGVVSAYDTVFANEVLYLVSWHVLSQYAQDAFRILRPRGEFVFQLNMQPISLITRLSWKFRHILYFWGIKKWRGWPTGPGYERFFHPVDKVRRMLEQVGFRVERISIGRSIRQTWFLAVKPE